jgi:hypothetical protein
MSGRLFQQITDLVTPGTSLIMEEFSCLGSILYINDHLVCLRREVVARDSIKDIYELAYTQCTRFNQIQGSHAIERLTTRKDIVWVHYYQGCSKPQNNG